MASRVTSKKDALFEYHWILWTEENSTAAQGLINLVFFWISWYVVISRDSKSIPCLQVYSTHSVCLLSLMRVSRDKRVCLQVWVCKSNKWQTDMGQDPNAQLINICWSNRDSKSSFLPEQHLGQTTNLYTNATAHKELEGQGPTAQSIWWMQIIADILSPTAVME